MKTKSTRIGKDIFADTTTTSPERHSRPQLLEVMMR